MFNAIALREDDHVYGRRAPFCSSLQGGNAPVAAQYTVLVLRLKASELSIRIFFSSFIYFFVSHGTIAQYGFSSQTF